MIFLKPGPLGVPNDRRSIFWFVKTAYFFSLIFFGMVATEFVWASTEDSLHRLVTPRAFCSLALQKFRMAVAAIQGQSRNLNPSVFEKASNPPLRFNFSEFIQVHVPPFVKPLMDFAPPFIHAHYFHQEILKNNPKNSEDYFQIGLRLVAPQLIFDASDLDKLPEPPFTIIANHPTGVPDGLVLAEILRRKQLLDFKIFVAYFLKETFDQIPYLKSHFEYLDRTDHPQRDNRNHAAFKNFVKDRKKGMIHILFPAGSIAGAQGERSWSPSTASIAEASPNIVPVYLEAKNPDLYYQFDRLHPTLRRSLYFWVAMKQTGRPFRVRIGTPIAGSEIKVWAGTKPEKTERLRDIVMSLVHRP